ncbi:nitrilase [Leishmania donovani]|uniref:Nitrilase_-_putative n=3 Tax=Leishmania donovani species complex TaxID=38574 RepID=A0A6L0XSK3_LEIIN|nr:putative nitrilase [Leishmania infantum JPCM5]TPP52097.1 Carbon-nitrogen hydrolase family protein [Leishmania donovani]CAC9497599.1 nitrilase_-_putative [Leishmania infantum]CAJ1989819.1 nitrilase [Leishmania donovani]CAM68945.1 putative nitrilase [Leishmania infantum JPCM5]SUZ42822.1 nitrilase_-_putative [Leishmania infantum]|eukprot:XP_001470566.1 putative nitrilase [Leishmania infantum JPCM5]
MASVLPVTLCQMAVTREKAANIKKAVTMITEAAKRGSKLAVLPECFNCPYGTKYFDEYSEALAPGNETFDAISQCAKENSIWIVAGSIPEKSADGKLFNSSMTFGSDGALKHVHRKVHLFRINTDTVRFDEGEVLSAGNDATAISLDEHTKFGVAICFDIRYPFLAWKYTEQGTSFIVYPGAFNMVTGPMHWQLAARARAVDNQQYVFLCSPARDTSAEYVAWGHSMVVDPFGNVLSELDEKEGFVDWKVDLSVIQDMRNRVPILKGVRDDLYTLHWKK